MFEVERKLSDSEVTKLREEMGKIYKKPIYKKSIKILNNSKKKLPIPRI